MSTHYRSVAAFLALSQLALVACVSEKDTRNMTEPAIGVASNRQATLREWSEPVRLGINTSYTEQQPALSKDGLSLYFMSSRPESLNDAVLDFNIWFRTAPASIVHGRSPSRSRLE
jgi:hypothetical protein